MSDAVRNTTDEPQPWQAELTADMDDMELSEAAVEAWTEWLHGKGKLRDVGGTWELCVNVRQALKIAREQERKR